MNPLLEQSDSQPNSFHHERLTGFLNHGVMPFVGRTQEFQQLLLFWRGTLQAHGLRAALLTWEAGIGKSRLVEELMPQIAREGGTVVHIRFYPESAIHPAHLLADALWGSASAREIVRDPAPDNLQGCIVALRRLVRLRHFRRGLPHSRRSACETPAGSRWFDGESGAVTSAALIDDGVQTMWLLNASAARQLNLEPGHATAGHGGPPGIGTSNVFVKPGTEDLATLMRNAGRGLFVTDMFSPSLNMNTADWSVGVAGYWFENGEIVHPVSEITVAGNLLDIFKRLRCGADVDNRGSLEISSLIVDDLAIGGV